MVGIGAALGERYVGTTTRPCELGGRRVDTESANLALRFLLELCALAALCYWGFNTGTGPISKVVLGIGAPLAAAVLWGTFVAPAAPVSVPGALRLLLELAVFGGAAAALYSAGRPGLAWALGLAYVINRVLMFVWDQ